MKNLAILFALLFGFTTAYSQYTGPTATENGSFTTRIIQPFLIQNDQESTNDMKLPDLVAGTTRTITTADGHGGGLYIFKITKEKGPIVDFTFSGPNTVDGVTINAQWYWTYAHPGTLLPPAYNAIPAGWWWGASSDAMDPVIPGTNTVQVFAFLKVNTVSCPAGTLPGTRTFTVNASGAYRAL